MDDPHHDDSDDVGDESVAFEELQRELERGLAEAYGGFEVLDRDLELDGSGAADLVGVDAEGRLGLVVLLGPSEVGARQGGDALERALDLAADAHARRALVERHVGRALAAEPPFVVLVSESFPAALARRVALLGPLGAVRLVEVSELKSALGATTVFTPLGAEPVGAADARGMAAFVAPLDDELAALVDLLVARLRRLDADLAVATRGDALEWRWRGRPLCSVEAVQGRLEGRVDGPAEPAAGESTEPARVRPIADRRGAEGFVDAALTRFLDLCDEEPPERGRREGLLRDVALRPPASSAGAGDDGPLLTDEELDAFRD